MAGSACGRQRGRRRRRRHREFLINSSKQYEAEVERREAAEAAATEAGNQVQQASLFVTKIRYSATKDDIRRYFEARVGEPGSVRVNVHQRDDPHSLVQGKKTSKGMANVQMDTPQLAQQILRMCEPHHSGNQSGNQCRGSVAQQPPDRPGGGLHPPEPATLTSAKVHMHNNQPLMVHPDKRRDRTGAAHVKGDFVSIPIQQLHIGCLVSEQQRQQLHEDSPKWQQLAGSAMWEDSLLISERAFKLNLDDLDLYCDDPEDAPQSYLQLNMRKCILRICSNYDLFPSLDPSPLQLGSPCVTKIEANFEVVHEALQPVTVSRKQGPSLPDKALAFTLLQPPHIFRGTRKLDAFSCDSPAVDNTFQYSAGYDDDNDFVWSRVPDVTGNGSFGRCMTYCVVLGSLAAEKLEDAQVTKKLVSFGLLPKAATRQGLWRQVMAPPALLLMEVTEEEVAAQVAAIRRQLACFPIPVAWHLECLLGSGAIHMWHLSWSEQVDGKAGVLSLLATAPEVQAVKVLQTLFAGERPLRRNLSYLLQQLLAERVWEEADEQRGAMMVPRVRLTPTGYKLLPPQAEEGNRLLRAFTTGVPGLDEWTLVRVQVGEEDGQRLFPGVQGAMDHVWDYLPDKLAGLNLAGRQYQFLVYSSSQLKEQSICMIRDSQETLRAVLARARGTIGDREFNSPMEAVYAWLGDFSHIKTPAKAAARMGQALSTTQRTIHMAEKEVKIGKDVWRKGNCFTDGACQISLQLLGDILQQLNEGQRGRRRTVPYTTGNVSALQIRLGGAKGVVSLNPRLRGRQLVLRPSMVKFDAPHHRELEVCSVARRVPCYLCRPWILLLSNAGVPDEVFLAKQRTFIQQLDDMLEDPEVAAEVLPTLGGINCLYLLQDMLEAGISPQGDPFLSSCLRAVRGHSLMMLEHRARILIPPRHAATLMGTPDDSQLVEDDDSGLLEEDEVFLQVGDPARGEEFRVVSGPVLVTKFPATHPGDVRMLTAVDRSDVCSRLGHHKNELVFSVKGDRPLPNQMSGSDLDGDQYAVTWDESLFPTKPNYPPQGYEGAKAPEKPGGVSVPGDLIKHFIDYARNDNLGRICNAWMAHADRTLMDGRDIIHKAVCTKLSELASIAVDFAKSGIPAELNQSLLPTEVPHYQNDKYKTTYQSTSIVGQLFDAVVHEAKRAAKEDKADEESHWRSMEDDADMASTQTQQGSSLRCDLTSSDDDDDDDYEHVVWPTHCDSLLRAEGQGQQHVGWRAWVDLAWELQDEYVDGIHQLFNRYGLRDEGELITGCVRKFHKLVSKSKQHDTREFIKLDVELLARQLRRRLFVEVLAHRERQHPQQQQQESADMGSLIGAVDRGSPDLVAAASACYWVAYSHGGYDATGRDRSLVPLLGLPWIIAGDVLAQYRVHILEQEQEQRVVVD